MATTTRAIDPVCDMEVDPATAIAVDYSRTRYYFCESVCAETFNEEPERWARPEVGRQSSAVDS